MSVVVSTESVGACKQQLEVSVPAAAVGAETDRVVGEYRRQARIPGFRKGKVPVDVVKKQFAEEIRQELIDRLLPRYWRQAEAEVSLEPMMPPQVEEVDLQDDGSLRFVATVETRPEIRLGNIESFDLPEVPIDPSDEEIEAALEDIRKEVSDWVEVDRAAAQGDLVAGDLFEVDDEGERSAEGQPIRFELGEPRVWEELSLAATSKKAEQTVEFERTEGEGDEAETRSFALAIEKIQERDLMPLDDSLAKKIGDYEDFAALRAAVAGRIRAGKRQERRSQREGALISQLLERHPAEMPEGVVQQEVEGMLREYAEGMVMRGVDVENAEINWQEMGEKMAPQAAARVRARLILDAIAKDREIEVDAAELESALSDIGKAQQMSTTEVRQRLAKNGGLDRLESQLKHDKVVRQLLGEEDLPSADGSDADSADESDEAAADVADSEESSE